MGVSSLCSEQLEAHVPPGVRLDIGEERTHLHEQRIASAIHGWIRDEETQRALTPIDLHHHRVTVREERVESTLRRSESSRELAHLCRRVAKLGRGRRQ